MGGNQGHHPVILSQRDRCRRDLVIKTFDAAQQIMQMHKDIVYEYPPNVEPLGRSDLCEVQGMYLPERLISVQGHPEFVQEIMEEILEGRRKQGLFGDGVFEGGMARAGKGQDGVEVAAAFLRFMLEGR